MCLCVNFVQVDFSGKDLELCVFVGLLGSILLKFESLNIKKGHTEIHIC